MVQDESVHRFIKTSLTRDEGMYMILPDLYELYRQWCGSNYIFPSTKRQFAQSLRFHGFVIQRKGTKNINVVCGVRLTNMST